MFGVKMAKAKKAVKKAAKKVVGG
ncbi:uncharacterized protein METZ01_LOCUS391233, partial [marine metagenome]